MHTPHSENGPKERHPLIVLSALVVTVLVEPTTAATWPEGATVLTTLL